MLLLVDPAEGATTDTPSTGLLVRSGADGAEQARAALPTASLDIWKVFWSGASCAWTSAGFGVLITREMTRSSDGLNHQGATAAVFNPVTLALMKSYGQTTESTCA